MSGQPPRSRHMCYHDFQLPLWLSTKARCALALILLVVTLLGSAHSAIVIDLAGEFLDSDAGHNRHQEDIPANVSGPRCPIGSLPDLQKRGVVADGVHDNTPAFLALLKDIGSKNVTLLFPPGLTSLGSITIPQTVTLDFSLGGIRVLDGQIVTIVGDIKHTKQQVFFNALEGKGKVEFTGNSILDNIYPEWWGASPNATPATNTPAIQAAIIASFEHRLRATTAVSRRSQTLHFSGLYSLDDELRVYHMIGFRWEGANKFSGLLQTAKNKRIIDGQSVAYGVFNQLLFETSAVQNVPLVDIDYNGLQGPDLRPQNITFNDCFWVGNGLGQIGMLLSKSGGKAQGDNIRFYNNYWIGFTEAAMQIGGNNTGVNVGRFYAQNAMLVLHEGGDIQGSPKYGIASYGGSVIVKDMSFENDSAGFGTQTGFDVYCEAPQETCLMENVRSESHKLMAGGRLRIINSRTIFQAQQFYSPTTSMAGTSWPAGAIVSGTGIGGDGKYYQIAVGGVWGGLGNTAATSGDPTSIADSTARWTRDAFLGYRCTIISGAGVGHYGIVTGNDETTITVGAGWTTNYSLMPDQTPDTTSHFVVEPNWGTQTTSGSVAFVPFDFNVVEGDIGGIANATLEDSVTLAGGRIRAVGHFRDLIVSRTDWLNAGFPLDDNIVTQRYTSIMISRPGDQIPGNRKLAWSFPRNGSRQYSNYSQMQLGTVPIVWSAGQNGGGVSAADVSIGGRSDPESKASTSRAILEYSGVLGRATPFGTNQNGAATQIQGGLSTGGGIPGPIEFWIGRPGSPGSMVREGYPVAGIKENGLSWTKYGPPVASASTVVPTGNLFHITGTTNITSVSGKGMAPGTEITIIFDDALMVADGSNLKLAASFWTLPNSTITLTWDGSNWYEKGRSNGFGSNEGPESSRSTDFIGEITAVNNRATYTFIGKYTLHPICIANNESTLGRDIKITYNGTTSVTFTTPGMSDLVSYACFSRR